MITSSPISQLAEDMAYFYDKPYEYVMYAFPWGRGQLLNCEGPREWQKRHLLAIGEEVRRRNFNGVNPVSPIQRATASGHGIGKSALVAWLIKWILDTRPYSKGVVTANTAPQLKTKTWAELGKWHNMSITRDMYDYRASHGNMCLSNKHAPEQWRCDALTCREEASEGFAGLHAADSTPFYIFDESSAIPEKIFEVAQGGLTDGEPMWFLFGNPTRNTGFFYQCFNRMKHRWQTDHIDSRTVDGTNNDLFQQWIDDYGEDSDFVRVRVTGRFPRQSILQLIPSDIVRAAMGRHYDEIDYSYAPIILGDDVAWYGDDQNAIFLRQGLVSRLLWEGREVDTVDHAGIHAQFFNKENADASFVDAGMGAGVIDQLRRLGYTPVPVYFGSGSLRTDCANKRSQMWVDMRDWLRSGGAIPDNEDLFDELTSVEYHVNLKGQIVLEPKESMKKRGLSSPDRADSLAMTFCQPVPHRRNKADRLAETYRDNIVNFNYRNKRLKEGILR